MYSQDARTSASAINNSGVAEGLYAIEAAFYTDHLVIRGEIISPDMRLSDHLNSSVPSVEVRPLSMHRIDSGSRVDFPSSHAHIYKAHLLFILPVSEPARPDRHNNAAWTRTTVKRCWAGVGRYTVHGQIHVEMGRDQRHILRSLDHRQFIPVTSATMVLPDGQVQDCNAIIVNRNALEMVALRDD